jgi:hypothetical protein
VDVDVVAFPAEVRVRADVEDHVQVARGARALLPLAADADARALPHAGGDLDLDGLAPVAAVRLRAGDANARRGSPNGLEEIEGQVVLAVGPAARPAAGRPPRPPSPAQGIEDVVEAHAREAATTPEEIAELEGDALLAPAGPAGLLGAEGPARGGVPEAVVHLAFLGVGEGLVGLGGLLELVGRAGGLVDVRVVLPRELPVGGLDLVGVGAARDAEDLVVVASGHGAIVLGASRGGQSADGAEAAGPISGPGGTW